MMQLTMRGIVRAFILAALAVELAVSQSCPAGSPAGNQWAWRGPDCRVGNVAFGKPAYQTGLPDPSIRWFAPGSREWTAEKAVDGDTNQNPDANRCAQMNNRDGGTSVWLVDLGEPHVVSNVTLFNSMRQAWVAMEDVAVYVANTMSFDAAVHQGEVCGTFPGFLFNNATIRCNSEPVGRYVIVENDRDAPDKDHMIICEAIVMGYTPYDCTFCPNDCDRLRGCTVCPQGRDLPDCQRCNSRECDPEKCHCLLGGCGNGSCIAGCDNWYINADTGCDVHIAEPDLSNNAPQVRILSPTDVDIDYEQFSISDDDLAEYYQYALEMKSLDGDFNDFTIIEDTRVNHTVYNLIDYTNVTYFEDTRVNDTLYNVTDTNATNFEDTWVNDTLYNVTDLNGTYIEDTRVNDTFYNVAEDTNATYIDPSLPAFNWNRIKLRNLTAGGVYSFRIRPFRIIRETSWNNDGVAPGIPSPTITLKLDHVRVDIEVTTPNTTPLPELPAPRESPSMGGTYAVAVIVAILLSMGMVVLSGWLARNKAQRRAAAMAQ